MIIGLDASAKNEEKRRKSLPSRFAYYGDISEVTKKASENDPFAVLLSQIDFSLDQVSESLISWFQEKYGIDEFIKAKNEFYNFTGKIFADDLCYNQRIQYFLDFFLVQRPASPGTLAPEEMAHSPLDAFLKSEFLSKHPQKNDLETKFRVLCKFSHSFFAVVKSDKKNLILKDLINQKRYELAQLYDDSFNGFPKKSVVQGFIYTDDCHSYLSKGFLLHPPGSSKIIEKSIKKCIKSPDFNPLGLLFNFAKKHLLISRNQNLDLKKIYLS